MRQAEVQYFRARRKKRFGRPGQSTTTRSPKIGECRWEDTALKRLSDVTLGVPALIEIKDEIPDIAAHLLAQLVEAGEAPTRRLSTVSKRWAVKCGATRIRSPSSGGRCVASM